MLGVKFYIGHFQSLVPFWSVISVIWMSEFHVRLNKQMADYVKTDWMWCLLASEYLLEWFVEGRVHVRNIHFTIYIQAMPMEMNRYCQNNSICDRQTIYETRLLQQESARLWCMYAIPENLNCNLVVVIVIAAATATATAVLLVVPSNIDDYLSII